MNKYYIVFIMLTCASVLLGIRGYRDAALARHMLADKRAQADSLQAAWQAEERSLKEYIAAQDAKLAAVAAAKDAAIARAEQAATARPAIVEHIVRVAGDSAAVVKAVAELEASHAVQVNSLHEALAMSDSMVQAVNGKLTVTLFAHQALQAAYIAEQAKADAMERIERPKLIGFIPATPNEAFVGGLVVMTAVVTIMVFK